MINNATKPTVTILLGVPSVAVGALLALRLTGLELNLIGMIGILLQVGVDKKNAIMIIDFALETQRRDGLTAQQAVPRAWLLRFRPIMMTTLYAIMGNLPIALGLGAGAELHQPLGIAIVGGLLFSQLITLFITPVLYLWFDNMARQPANAAAGLCQSSIPATVLGPALHIRPEYHSVRHNSGCI